MNSAFIDYMAGQWTRRLLPKSGFHLKRTFGFSALILFGSLGEYLLSVYSYNHKNGKKKVVLRKKGKNVEELKTAAAEIVDAGRHNIRL